VSTMMIQDLPADCLTGWTIAFDLDGTLVDTAPDLVRVTNIIMADLGLAPVGLDRLRSLVGQGAAALLATAAAESGVIFDPDTLAAHRARFIEIYASDTFAESAPFAGLVDALAVLKNAGARLSVCTNKPRDLAMKVLNGLSLAEWFEIFICPEDTPAIKPDPIHVRASVETIGGTMDCAILVGDSDIDFQAARNAGIPVALATFGYSKTKASALGADALFDHYHQLPGLIRALARRAQP
jgi:phosphoglycolate phosphatase